MARRLAKLMRFKPAFGSGSRSVSHPHHRVSPRPSIQPYFRPGQYPAPGDVPARFRRLLLKDDVVIVQGAFPALASKWLITVIRLSTRRRRASNGSSSSRRHSSFAAQQDLAAYESLGWNLKVDYEYCPAPWAGPLARHAAQQLISETGSHLHSATY